MRVSRGPSLSPSAFSCPQNPGREPPAGLGRAALTAPQSYLGAEHPSPGVRHVPRAPPVCSRIVPRSEMRTLVSRAPTAPSGDTQGDGETTRNRRSVSAVASRINLPGAETSPLDLFIYLDLRSGGGPRRQRGEIQTPRQCALGKGNPRFPPSDASEGNRCPDPECVPRGLRTSAEWAAGGHPRPPAPGSEQARLTVPETLTLSA